VVRARSKWFRRIKKAWTSHPNRVLASPNPDNSHSEKFLTKVGRDYL